MKRVLLSFVCIALAVIATGCNYAKEQGTVSVEVSGGKVVKVHEPGDMYTTFGAYTYGYDVDLRNHTDGVDIEGVTSDNAPFYMKIDIVWHPQHTIGSAIDQDPIVKYLSAFGFEDDESNGYARSARRWGVFSQLVKNAGRDATSGKYDAYALRANQAAVLQAIQAELSDKFHNELFCEISSVGMEIQPQFKDPKIDEAANAVVAAKKQKDAEQAWKEAAQIRLEKQQIENTVWNSSPQAYELRKLDYQLSMVQEFSRGIASHQGTLILDPAMMRQLQLQSPLGAQK